MIRRDIRLADGAAGWMLISQLEHARVSAELAARCTGRFASNPQRAGSSPTPAPLHPSPLREEVLAAIRHHDDGWLSWEQSPRLDRTSGRPLTFTELEPAEAIAIWSASIAAATAVGPLAAWMVASHFLRLARRHADDKAHGELQSWRSQMVEHCAGWLASWQTQDPQQYTAEVAAAALEWLWTFDEISLWLCCTCLGDEPIPCAPDAYLAGRGTPLAMELAATGAAASTAMPWRFTASSIDVEITGQAVPAAHYQKPAELLAASVPHCLHWRLSAE